MATAAQQIAALEQENEALRNELMTTVMHVGLLRAAQRQYLRNRGDEELGAVVGKRADALDDYVANLSSI